MSDEEFAEKAKGDQVVRTVKVMITKTLYASGGYNIGIDSAGVPGSWDDFEEPPEEESTDEVEVLGILEYGVMVTKEGMCRSMTRTTSSDEISHYDEIDKAREE